MSFITYWQPIVVSAVLVFVTSAIVWTVLKWHNGDYRQTGDEEAVRGAMQGNAPGCYLLPYCRDRKDLQKPEVQQKYIDGPLAYITVIPNGMPTMGGKFVGSIIYYLLVGVLCAYVLSLSGSAQGSYLQVFRVTCTVAWIAYGVAYVQDSIWFGRPWGMTFKNLVDALLYGGVTGGTFGWLAGSA